MVGEPLHPRADDPLPWDLLSALDAVFFTGQDPALLALARHARMLVVPARRRQAILAARVPIDVIVGSRVDPREVSTRADYAIPPTALVMTDGARGGIVETRDGITPFRSPPVTMALGTYGAGDSFAGALTYYVGSGLSPAVAAGRAAHHGSAVIASLDPIAAQLPLPYEPVG